MEDAASRSSDRGRNSKMTERMPEDDAGQGGTTPADVVRRVKRAEGRSPGGRPAESDRGQGRTGASSGVREATGGDLRASATAVLRSGVLRDLLLCMGLTYPVALLALFDTMPIRCYSAAYTAGAAGALDLCGMLHPLVPIGYLTLLLLVLFGTLRLVRRRED